MGGTLRFPLADAEALANEVLALLEPACERIVVAGSIRRRKETIGDIEIVAIPNTREQLAVLDLFGEPLASMNVPDPLMNRCGALLAEGVLDYRLNKDGRRSYGPALKLLTYNHFALDVFSATPETWAVTLLIRTGPAYFSHRLATPKNQTAVRRDGGPSLYGLLPGHIQLKDWRYAHRGTGEPYDTLEEGDVFTLLGYEWLSPEERTDDATPKALVLA